MDKKKKKEKIYDYKRSFNYCIWLLSRRAYTEKGLIDKLKKKEAKAEVIEEVITKLKKIKYLDDQVYTEMYINSRKRSKGANAIRTELWRKGVSEEIIESALSELSSELQLETAINIVLREKWRFSKGDIKKDKARAYAFLARRGFSSDITQAALSASKLFDEYQ